MLKSVLNFFIVLWALLSMGGAAVAQPRLALVIGNSSYTSAPLLNPANDAALMTKTLEETGFDVTTIIDADQKTMKRALIEFGRRLRKSDAVGLFYYAGHGVQVRGENYLIPIGINIQDETEVEIEAINVNSFLGTMERSSSAINIVVLDACRNNPFTRSFRSVTRGLARVAAPRGSYIAYATAPGQVAYDGDSGNSPYTLALTKAIATPNLTIEQVFKQARREVLAATNERQTPWENSSIIGDFYFKQHTEQPLLLSQNDGPAPLSLVVEEKTVELASWETPKEPAHQTLFKSYLHQYPRELFSSIAVERIKKRPTYRTRTGLKPTPRLLGKARTLLTRKLQTELTRIGCSPGEVDGKWGPTGKSALKKFNHFARQNLKTSTVSRTAYRIIKNTSSRVCPAGCNAQSELVGGRCVSRIARMRSLIGAPSKIQPNCGIFNGSRFCQ